MFACECIAHCGSDDAPCKPHAFVACILAAVENVDRLCAELQATWHEEIPLAKQIGIEVVRFGGGELVARAPLAPNRNAHGTAFAGSLFSVCVLTGWGRLWLALRTAGARGRVVAADSRIEYRRGVSGELVCRCADSPALDGFATAGRAECTLTCTVDGGGAPAVRFEGRYVVFAHRER